MPAEEEAVAPFLAEEAAVVELPSRVEVVEAYCPEAAFQQAEEDSSFLLPPALEMEVAQLEGPRPCLASEELFQLQEPKVLFHPSSI